MGATQERTVLGRVGPGVLASKHDDRPQQEDIAVGIDLDFRLRLTHDPRARRLSIGRVSRPSPLTVTVFTEP
jgi:hypothetical protein